MAPEKGIATAAAVLDIAEAKPELHQQCTWVGAPNTCGTPRCIAGWAMHLHGYSDEEIWIHAEKPARRVSSVNYVAGDLLGLNVRDAYILFTANNEVALEGLRWVALGKELDWEAISGDSEYARDIGPL